MMLDTLRKVADDLRSVLSDFDPERVSGSDAADILATFAAIEKLASGGRTLAARRVESSNIWKRSGHRSAAAHVAEATGTGIGPAIDTLQTARRLASLPVADDALRSGRLSHAQVTAIASAAAAQPDAERSLVDAAAEQPFNTLKLRCRRVQATAEGQWSSYERIRRSRYLRHWTGNDGALHVDAIFAPDDGARLVSAIKIEAAKLAELARRSGCACFPDSPAALAADALIALVGFRAHGSEQRPPGSPAPRGARAVDRTDVTDQDDDVSSCGDGRQRNEAGPGRVGSSLPEVMVHVRVDHRALVRGHLDAGEVCEIPGIGPIPIDVAQALMTDSILSVLVTDGTDVRAVAHRGRTIAASVRRALVERDPVCVVPGCEVGERLEIDHLVPYAQGGPTALSNLARLCHWHHYLKTYQRYTLIRTAGGWEWEPPR